MKDKPTGPIQHKDSEHAYLKYRLIAPGEEKSFINIVTEVFNKSVAPQYTKEGITEFFKYANAIALAERTKENHFAAVAELNNKPVAVIEIRNNNHISLFFVKTKFQRKGIGKNLFRYAVKISLQNNPATKQITVHSSPNAVRAYEKMGFTSDDEEKCAHGIRFVPMSVELYAKRCR